MYVQYVQNYITSAFTISFITKLVDENGGNYDDKSGQGGGGGGGGDGGSSVKGVK